MRSVVAVAASGGHDSTALLHACARAARGTPVAVAALHVHHGLMPQADAWVRHLQAQCRRWARAGLPVRLLVEHLRGSPRSGDSVEAWARRERYDALARLAVQAGADCVLLAHHRRDQAETVMLQALRSAGGAGMGGMGGERVHAGVRFLRPWLEQPRAAIEAYVRRHRLSHVEDASNADPRFARSRLREQVWPALTEAFAHAEVALAGAARRLHEEHACAVDMARIDMQRCVEPAGSLEVRLWQALPPHRQASLLRQWLAGWCPCGVPDSLVERLLAELPVARGGSRWPAPAGGLSLTRGVLAWSPGDPVATPSTTGGRAMLRRSKPR
ncbi:MAG: tRNA lysidine(34) synthetase TilS [Rubrivivax sp.]